jgi:uncharacterized protein (DUF2126 family)/transglutaminase-like putative cysteine protease
MSIIVALNHVTHYRYDRPVAVGMQTVRLRPAPHTRSQVQSYSLSVTPAAHFINWQQDPFGNYLARLVFPEKINELRVEVDLVSEIRVFNPFDFFLENYAKDFPFTYETGLKEELAPYLELKENGPLLKQWASRVSRSKLGMVDFLVGINQETYNALKYVIRLDPGVQTPEETLSLGSGSCRDMAWLLCQLLRHLGFATRFASGYLIQLKADVKPIDGPAGAESDFTDLHAWTEVYLPGAGWVGLDATSGLFVGEGHIPLCCTPNPSSAAPISGTVEPCETTFTYRMEVTRVHESPRVTRPFMDAQWQAIDTLGGKVDKALGAQDVRLTMGGEPTFISDEDRASDEWHFTALSDNKKRLGKELFLRLRGRFAPGSVAQYTQGKWYPGEILPRWAMNCIWRRDGEPVWREDALLADPLAQAQGQGLKTAKTFLARLAGVLGIPADYSLPAYEDADYHAWREKTLPLSENLGKKDAYEKAERARLAALEAKLDQPSGYVLPLHFSPRRKGWISNRWRFQGGRLTLIPGDSPVGLRLPLGSLPSPKEAQEEYCPPRSPFEQVGALPTHAQLMKAAAKRTGKTPSAAFAKDKSGLIKSALCAQVREGMLHLFLPPLSYIEHFLDLVASIETVAADLRVPVVLEGYGPPADLRIRQMSVTPDPGVIEVNVQPASDWEELKTITGAVYEEAQKTRLSAEKFLVDGRRVGTGGGNHIVMGAAMPGDSPFLRRPDLLASMVTFWQNHPSLSYLFSSMYVGPTSQSPRIDEARHDSLYELEIALQRMEEVSGPVSPWLVDRLFRNLLVDLTGNTHRAEFCIDKLYSPDSDRGRLGLLEMRGFEMSPHPQMNLLQALLIRAAIAHFWKTPYRQKLVRWGTGLHDRFMMPHYLREDLHDVLQHLRLGGFDFRPEWFEPFFAFRFPACGTAQVGAVTMELHMALEPWPVLGEEMNAGSVSRSVDSSVERLQVTVRGALDARHRVTCNGRALPLHPTAERDVMVAAVRYKAWAPPSSLHPTIPVHTPLVFDLLDTQLRRSLGGCTYHVMHPGGRSYDTIPVNENEAEGRRLSRFEAMGHRPGRCAVPEPEANPDFPHTLDLRRAPVKAVKKA